MSEIFLDCNGYQSSILLESSFFEKNDALILRIDNKVIEHICFSNKNNDSVLLNINQICNSDFELGVECWQVSKEAHNDYEIGIDSGPDWTLENGHTAYLVQGHLFTQRVQIVYHDPMFAEFLPVEAGHLYQIGGSFACHRCEAFFILEFFNAKRQKIDQHKFTIASNKAGGKNLQNYHTFNEQICSPELAAFAKISLLKLPTEAKEKNSLLFFTRIFFALVSADSVELLEWSKCPFEMQAWIKQRKSNFNQYTRLTFDLPAEVYDGKEHLIEVLNQKNATSLVGSPKSFKFTDQQHKSLVEKFDLVKKQNKHKTAKKIQAVLNHIASLRFELIIEGFVNSQLQGWLRDRLYPRQILTLELHEQQTVLATAANKDLHIENGRGLFSFVLPESILDGKIHHFSLHIKEYGACIETWNFITPNPASKTKQSLVFIDNPIWDGISNTNTSLNRLIPPPQKREKIERLLAELAEFDDEDIKGRYQLTFKLGQRFLWNGELKDAVKYFYTAMNLADIPSEAFVAYIKTLIRLGKEKDAEDAIFDALEQKPENEILLELRDKLNASKRPKSAMFLAFYLPQFHPTPENDQWWGKGFTEWSNVTSATPLFEGHLQPRRPAGLGYYDLRLPETANAQFDLARRYGIDGFCYYYYWFHGKRVLDRPLQDLVDGKTGPFPFCICWANEDWTRSWDGYSGEVLLAQDHTPESDFQFIKDITPLLKHPDYVRVDGKPVLLIYRADKLATPTETVIAWREWCREQGIGELHLCAVQAFSFDDPRPLGFDAAVEFPPHWLKGKHPGLNHHQEISSEVKDLVDGFSGKIFDYQVFSKAFIERPREPYTLHRSCFLAWDNSARRHKHATVFHRFTPALYQNWLSEISVKNATEQSTGLTFINAWNEWAEGATLEPDSFFGHHLLERTYQTKRLLPYLAQKTYWKHKRPLLPLEWIEEGDRILLVGHDANFNGAQINLLNMARSLRRDLGAQVIIALMQDGPLLHDYEKVGPTLVLKGKKWQKKFANFIRHYADFGTHKAICNTVVTGEIVKLLREHDYRVISLVHELPSLIESYNLQSACWQLAYHANNIVFASKVVADSFCHRYWPDPKKILIAPQGIVLSRHYQKRALMRTRLREELELAEKTKLIIGCGYADVRKGIDLFVRMASEVTNSYGADKVAFVWVGELERSVKPYIIADIEHLKLKHIFHITGKTDAPARYFAGADIFALTSREDPFPSVVMEAFDAGLPVVAFDGGGGYVDIVNTSTGALVPYLDVSAMSAEILKLLNDETFCEKISSYNHQLCRERFTYKAYLQKLLALLNGVPTVQIAAGFIKRQGWIALTPRPTITAIVPNYNYGRYLELRLRTVIDQTLAPTEIIILDDASTDYSMELISAIAKQTTIPIQIIRNETNSGNVFVQWAKGLELAQSELVWIAEADDYCEPTLLETLAKEFVDESVNMAWVDSLMVDDNGHSHGTEYKKYYSANYGWFWNADFKMSGTELIDKCLLVANIVPNASAALFRRKSITKQNLELIKAYRFSGDWWFWLSLAQTGNVVYCAEALNYHRRHKLSVMGDILTDSDKFLTESMHFFERIIKYKPECLTPKVRIQILERLEGMYQLYPELVATYPRFKDHPDFQAQYLALYTALAPMQALTEIYTETPALLVVSEDVLKEKQVLLAVINVCKIKHNLEIVLLMETHKHDLLIEKWQKKIPTLLVIRGKGCKNLVEIFTAELGFSLKLEHKKFISFGLLAHIFVDSLLGKHSLQWLILAEKDFDNLLGKTPVNPEVSISKLQAVLQNATEVQFVGEKAPLALQILTEEICLPIDNSLLPVIKEKNSEADEKTPVYVLGVAINATVEEWQQVAESLQQAAEQEQRPIILRILAWGKYVKGMEKLGQNKNVEIITIFTPPPDFSMIAAAGLVINKKEFANYLILDFKRTDFSIISNESFL